MQKIKVYPAQLLHEWNRSSIGNGSSLPLGMLMSYAKSFKNELLGNTFDFQPIINRYIDEFDFYLDAASNNPPAIWLTSHYIWNHDVNLKLIAAIKERSPHSLVIVGGPHIPAYEEENRAFLERHPYIDITARGEGEVTFAEILEVIAEKSAITQDVDFSCVKGITFRKNQKLVRTPDRVRSKNIDIFPSPYITGEFDHPSFNDLPITIMETNRGCPFGCTFCDWGSATLQKFSLFDLERVKKEIEWAGQRRAELIYLGDSNFGAFERDVEIAEFVVKTKIKYGYPKNLGMSFAKNASPRLAKILKILGEAKLIKAGLISIQTSDEATLSAINRSNIRNDKYEKLIEIIKKENLKLSSELMIGLPGQTVESHKNDLQFFIDRKLMTIAYPTAVMPNAPMNEPSYRLKYRITTDKEGYVTSTSSFSEDELNEMLKLFLAFQFFYGLGVLKYYLYFIQLEHSIKAMDFIHSLLKVTKNNPDKYPLNSKLQEKLLTTIYRWSPCLDWKAGESDFIFSHMNEYYDEIIKFTSEQYGITLHPAEKSTLFEAQKAVMPSVGKTLPFSVDLPHDLIAYMEQIKKMTVVQSGKDNFRPLVDYPSGILEVSALKKKTIANLSLAKFDRYIGTGWELRSKLRMS